MAMVESASNTEAILVLDKTPFYAEKVGKWAILAL